MLTDLRLALRSLTRRPASSILPIFSLALGIGAATGVFSIVHAILLRPLPYPDPDRLVRVFEVSTPAQGAELRSIAIPTLADWRGDVHLFEGLALYGPATFDLAGGDGAEQVDGAVTSASFFGVLGVSPLWGRGFTEEEERPGSVPVAVLGYGLWQRRFGGNVDVIGQTLRLNRQSFTVIGVMPPRFAFPTGAELWASLAIDEEYGARGARHMSGLARLKPDVSLTSATTELLAAERRLATRYPENYADRGVRLIPLEERLVGGVRPALLVLSGAVVLVLLIACVNVANLLLTRATARRHEMAICLAVGASRLRLARQMLCEALVLFVTSGLIGLAVAATVVQTVRRLSADVLPRAETVELNWSVALFAALIALATGVVFGLVPAWQASSVPPAASLLEGRRGSTRGRSVSRLHGSLIVAETALAAMLLVGAGLLVRSLQQLTRVDPGFPVANVVTFDLSAPPAVAKQRDTVVEFFREVRERAAGIPGVRGVGLASRLPLSGADHSNGFRLEGETSDPEREHSAQDRSVSPGFFRALGIPVLRGREFTDADSATSQPVIVVNATFARQYLPSDAIGQRVIRSRAGGVARELVGIVGDTRQFGLDAPAISEFYLPHAQDPWPFLSVAVRTAGDPTTILPQLRSIVASMDPELPLRRVQTMEQMTSDEGTRRRMITVVLGVFAGVAYLLAAVGLYGVVASAVAARTSEIGIRVALGAPRRHVIGLVIGRGVALAAVGVACGLAAAMPLTRWLRDLLFGVTESDPVTLIGVGLLVPAIALLAAIVPTRRALAIDPVRAIRAE
ncbi:MAG TPA: ABC transporter permease [Vicinamibacterales bacterium]|nr:ABC transporter permease [Vicinamibacterales bacterium]